LTLLPFLHYVSLNEHREKRNTGVKVQHKGKFVAYYRVSTPKQGASGLGLEAQRTAVEEHLNGGRWKLVGEFKEIESGKKNDRPALAKALAACRVHGATLIIAKLDQLARNVAFISNLMEAGVEFEAVDFPQANRLTVHILAAVAEHEAAMISARTKAALAAAKKRGVKLGGDRAGIIASQSPKGVKASMKVRREKAQKRAADLLPEIEAIRAEGVTSLRQIAEALTERGIPAPRGGAWQAVQVQRALRAAAVQVQRVLPAADAL
jgi:DNA invertase Pin-like site-specific DNA recombinase